MTLNNIFVLQVKGTKYMTIHTIFANFYALKKSEY